MTTAADLDVTRSKQRFAYKSLPSLVLACLLCLALNSSVCSQQPDDVRPDVKQIEFDLQTRDAATGKVVVTREKVDAARIGVIAVDVWNFHWCKTATMRVDAFVPRINKALEAARSLGMTVMLCPSDVVDNYVGLPQREAVLALSTVPVPNVLEVKCPPASVRSETRVPAICWSGWN